MPSPGLSSHDGEASGPPWGPQSSGQGPLKPRRTSPTVSAFSRVAGCVTPGSRSRWLPLHLCGRPGLDSQLQTWPYHLRATCLHDEPLNFCTCMSEWPSSPRSERSATACFLGLDAAEAPPLPHSVLASELKVELCGRCWNPVLRGKSPQKLERTDVGHPRSLPHRVHLLGGAGGQ